MRLVTSSLSSRSKASIYLYASDLDLNAWLISWSCVKSIGDKYTSLTYLKCPHGCESRDEIAIVTVQQQPWLHLACFFIRFPRHESYLSRSWEQQGYASPVAGRSQIRLTNRPAVRVCSWTSFGLPFGASGQCNCQRCLIDGYWFLTSQQGRLIGPPENGRSLQVNNMQVSRGTP